MTSKFASIELARLYETQGYIDDAVSMYKQLEDDEPEGNTEIRAAIKRLELVLAKKDSPDLTPADAIEQTLAQLNQDETEGNDGDFPALDEIEEYPAPRSSREKNMARLLEKWLMLMVVQKRVSLFKAIKARL